jgi:hypothetical protein
MALIEGARSEDGEGAILVRWPAGRVTPQVNTFAEVLESVIERRKHRFETAIVARIAERPFFGNRP